MSRHDFFYSPPCGKDAQTAQRRGLTLVEILISVALMTVIMLAAIRVLSYVSAELSRSQSAMIIAGRARTVQLQIERDLGCITAPLTPPLRFDDAQGYFCIIEGLGAYYGNLKITNGIAHGWNIDAIAINPDADYDSTIGDMDDILMFTARAPGDSMYRGLVGGEIMESKEAEICLFLRGTTLYRRVLLIIPDEVLQAKIVSFSPSMFDGKGFYRHFDVSVRLDENGRIKANTLADLTRRENRFGHANDPSITNPLPFPYGIHNNAAWYQLRLPTLAECTLASKDFLWQAGTQIVTSGSTSKFNKLENVLLYSGDSTSKCADFPTGGLPYIDFWNKPLPWSNLSNSGSLTPKSGDNVDIFVAGTDPYGTFLVRENDDVLLTNVISFDIKVWDTKNVRWNIDTNRWEQLPPGFVDLGHMGFNNGGEVGDPRLIAAHIPEYAAVDYRNMFVSQGFYGTFENDSSPGSHNANCYSSISGGIQYSLLPSVYDTGTDAYENELVDTINSVFSPSAALDMNGNQNQGISNLDGITDIMEHVDLWRCPPPYNVPLTGIQIKIRVFDPDTNNIREVTIRKNFQ